MLTSMFTVQEWQLKKLKKMAQGKQGNVEQLIDVAFNFEYTGSFPKQWSITIAPVQNKPEIEGLLHVVKDLHPEGYC